MLTDEQLSHVLHRLIKGNHSNNLLVSLKRQGLEP